MKLGVLEGLLFVSGEDGLSKEEIMRLLDLDEQGTQDILDKFSNELKADNRGLKLVYLGNKYKLSTKEEHKEYYELLVHETISSTLTQASLEVLAIIAYNEPVSIGMIDEIRGVSSRDIVRKLLYRGLIDFAGKSDLPGKPMLYKTTNKFLDYFNLSSLGDLPELKVPEDVSDDEKELFISKYKENE